METLRLDLAFALRMLRRSPIFTLVAVSAIALGSAAVTTIYSLVNAVLLQPPAGVRDGDRLVTIQKTNRFMNGFSNMSYPLYRDLRDGAKSLDGIAAFTQAKVDLAMTGVAERESMAGLLVSGNYFDVLHVKPAAGRFFLADEDRVPNAAPVAVISYRLWVDRFARSPAAIGQKILLQNTPFTIVGVAPEGFNGVTAFVQEDLYVPTMMTATIRPNSSQLLDSWASGWLTVFGRLNPTASRAVAEQELGAVAVQSRDRAAETGDIKVQLKQMRPVPANGVSSVSVFMAVLMTVAALVLLIAGSNVASMLLARAVTRRKEFVVRLAIGAGRARLIRQLLTESVLLFIAGGVAGFVLTAILVRFAAGFSIAADAAPAVLTLPLDTRVLLFTLATSFVVGLGFGLVPALHASRRDLADVLRAESGGSGGRRERARNVLVVSQLAMSVLLLVCAGLFVRAFAKGRLISPGYTMDGVIVAPITLSSAGYDSTRARQFYADVAARLAARPDVEAVSTSDMVPLSTSNRMTAIDIPGVVPANRMPHSFVSYEAVGRDYFRALDLPLVAGRAFGENDTPTSTPVAIVTEKFARRYFKLGPTPADVAGAIGRTFTHSKRQLTIVGVAKDARLISLTDEPEPFMFLPASQDGDADLDLVVRVRTPSATAAVTQAISDEVHAIDGTIVRPKVETLRGAAALGLLPQRIAAGVTAALGLAGLLLASLGLYGVVAYGVNQRTRELGIRMALGADTRRIIGMVLSDGGRLVAIGTGLGLVLAVAGSRVLARFLFGVSPTDPLTLLAVPMVLVLVTVAATWLPARRATRIGVAAALRSE